VKILIICSNLVGDTVLSTGVISYFQKKYPESLITFIAGPKAISLFNNSTNIDQIHSVKKKKFNLHWFDIYFKTIKIKWDIIVDLRSSLLSYFLANKKKYIFKKKTNIHHILQLTQSLGFDCSNLKIDTNELEEKIAKKQIKSDFKHLIVFPGGNWEPKIWPIEKYNKMLIKLYQSNNKIKFILVGSAEEKKDYLFNISKNIPSENIIDIFGESLTQTAAYMKFSDLFIGNDSGLMHLSCACNLKTISLFGPTDDKIYGPWGKENIVIRTKENLDHFNKLNLDEKKSYMDTITVDQVYQMLIKFLN
tara:strand:+ start:933 stop:1850 length:918 start_codon:yes stop_codon:yes gene_type:complete